MLNNYFHDPSIHRLDSAKAIVPFLVQEFKPKSVIDIGCGNGNWLKLFNEFGVNEIMGVEGNTLGHDALLVRNEEIVYHDLNIEFSSNRKYDLALCLEVAEHLRPESSDTIVNSLVKLSDVIIFSAAIPGQGGQNHLNEQWPNFWVTKFEKNGFRFVDKFRRRFWMNSNIDFWYRQNLFLVVKKKEEECIQKEQYIMDIVHPELWRRANQKIEDISQGRLGFRFTFSILRKNILNKLKSLISR